MEEKPILSSFRFEGERVNEDELVQALELRPNQPFGETERRNTERLAQELVGDAVKVTATTTTDVTEDLVTLVISVEPVELETIQQIRLIGNDAIPDSELRDAMRSKQKRLDHVDHG